MAIRIKSKWSKTVKRDKTSEDFASAMSYIGWRLALDKARNLHGEDFEYTSDHQRISVIVEFMSFQVHLADRLLFGDDHSENFRVEVMNKIGSHSARTMQENCEDLFGAGDYRTGYIKTLNLRSSEYSDYAFSGTHISSQIKKSILASINEFLLFELIISNGKMTKFL